MRWWRRGVHQSCMNQLGAGVGPWRVFLWKSSFLPLVKGPLAYSCSRGVEDDSYGTEEAMGRKGWPSRHGTEQGGVSSAPCAACSLQWKGQEILQMGAEKGCSPTHLFSETPEILPAKQNMSEERHGACWHLLRHGIGLGWDGHSWGASGV